jgi:hypothetical protein
MPDSDAERLRKAVVDTIRYPYPESVFIPPPDDIWPKLAKWAKENGTTVDAISADTIRKCVGQEHAAQRICAAIVEEFGLTKHLGKKWWQLARLPSDDWRDVCIAILDIAEGK